MVTSINSFNKLNQYDNKKRVLNTNNQKGKVSTKYKINTLNKF